MVRVVEVVGAMGRSHLGILRTAAKGQPRPNGAKNPSQRGAMAWVSRVSL